MDAVFIGKEKLRLTNRLHDDAERLKEIENMRVSAISEYEHTKKLLEILSHDEERYMQMVDFDAYELELYQSFVTQLNPPAVIAKNFLTVIKQSNYHRSKSV